MRILLIEDDKAIGGAVREHVAAGGHAVDWAETLSTARDCAAGVPYGLILLDIRLPDGNGIDYLREMRKRLDSTPVIILTAHDLMIEGLNAGADDYLVKPFDLGELSARIHAVARRYRLFPESIFSVGDLSIQSAERRLYRDGQLVPLTPREWAVLDCLLSRPGAIATKAQIENALYSFGSEIASNAVEVYVSRLRKSIGAEHIATERGFGYRVVLP
ncbi:MAG: response regulator transcription factor [Mesorhizobium sp.]|uniref:response regulator transcription factor n=1 Tax=Mesorhizobium TaxID=68287 RepID=UPI0007EE142C|nr:MULTISPECIES: response regulator transcription factor [Mesorhizobium]PBB51918.1 DNA-binding response regulator [Mesorhizobium loti]QIA25559.1 response regulator transcription factor [Mesorhizobium sp. AA22]TIL80259.1 MAG: response regulator transcription factor [Mesorhizobium sp.]